MYLVISKTYQGKQTYLNKHKHEFIPNCHYYIIIVIKQNVTMYKFNEQEHLLYFNCPTVFVHVTLKACKYMFVFMWSNIHV